MLANNGWIGKNKDKSWCSPLILLGVIIVAIYRMAWSFWMHMQLARMVLSYSCAKCMAILWLHTLWLLFWVCQARFLGHVLADFTAHHDSSVTSSLMCHLFCTISSWGYVNLGHLDMLRFTFSHLHVRILGQMTNFHLVNAITMTSDEFSGRKMKRKIMKIVKWNYLNLIQFPTMSL